MKDTNITITGKQKRLILAVLLCLLIVAFTAASCGGDSTPNTQYSAPAANAYCDESASVTCKMINERYDFLKDPDRVGYFYGFQGSATSPIVEYVVRGMVVDVNNQTTPPDYQEPCNSYSGSACAVVRQAKQPDQTWGENGYNTVFGFRADGAYFEWKGSYEFDSTPNPQLHPLSVLGCKSFTAVGKNKGQVIRPDC